MGDNQLKNDIPGAMKDSIILHRYVDLMGCLGNAATLWQLSFSFINCV